MKLAVLVLQTENCECCYPPASCLYAIIAEWCQPAGAAADTAKPWRGAAAAAAAAPVSAANAAVGNSLCL